MPVSRQCNGDIVAVIDKSMDLAIYNVSKFCAGTKSAVNTVSECTNLSFYCNGYNRAWARLLGELVSTMKKLTDSLFKGYYCSHLFSFVEPRLQFQIASLQF